MEGFNLWTCACTGGTYGPLHEGHKKVFRYAFSLAKNLAIRLTTDEYLSEISKKNLKELIPPYSKRFETLCEYLNQLYRGRFEILPLDTREDCMNCMYKDITMAMIAGEDSLAKAYRINLRRRESGLFEVDIFGVPAELSESGKRISSTDIRKGEINRKGRIIIP
jgi:pantetheine-phosphate adenylyltransferase